MSGEPPRPRTADERGVAAAKSVLRKAVLLRRETRSAADRMVADKRRTDQLLQRLGTQLPSVVAAYLSSGSEPGTLQLVAWLAAQDVRVLLPVLGDPAIPIHDREPAWGQYTGPDSLRVGPFSILEPTGPALPAAALGDAGLVVCPGLAGSVAGDRLGRGGGWYDRALRHAAPGTPAWMLLNADEVLDTIPTDSHDMRVEAIVTPTGLVPCSPKRT